MKIRTAENLYDYLSNESAWRKKELADFRTLVEIKSLSVSKREAVLRAGITLLYAHWEGFIKTAAEAYLEYVSMQRLRYHELSSNFVAICLKAKLNDAESSNQAIAHRKVVEFFINDFASRSTLPYKNVINTKSNLSSSVLQNILCMLDFDYSIYQTNEKLIDEKLLDSRNNIAHGKYLLIDEKDFSLLLERVLMMMDLFRNQVDNSIATKSFTVTS